MLLDTYCRLLISVDQKITLITSIPTWLHLTMQITTLAYILGTIGERHVPPSDKGNLRWLVPIQQSERVGSDSETRGRPQE